MGDVGSGFLGFALGVLAIATSHSGAINLWVWLILLGDFLVDATVTLLTRVARGDRWYGAHRSHAYQHTARLMGSHLPLPVAVAVINLVWLASGLVRGRVSMLGMDAHQHCLRKLVAGAMWLRAGQSEGPVQPV